MTSASSSTHSWSLVCLPAVPPTPAVHPGGPLLPSSPQGTSNMWWPVCPGFHSHWPAFYQERAFRAEHSDPKGATPATYWLVCRLWGDAGLLVYEESCYTHVYFRPWECDVQEIRAGGGGKVENSYTNASARACKARLQVATDT